MGPKDNLNDPTKVVKPGQTQTVPSKVTPAPSPSVPKKYDGKSLADVVDMHANAEKLVAKQGAELADARKELEKAKATEGKAVDLIASLEKRVADAEEAKVEADKQLAEIPEKLKAAEEKGKAMGIEEEKGIILASGVDSSRKSPPVPSKVKEKQVELNSHLRKGDAEAYFADEATMSDAEKKAIGVE